MERIKRSETIGYKIRLLHNQIHKNMEAKRMENEDNLTGMQRLMLTDKAAALLDGAERDIREMEARLTAGLSAEDVEHLKRCLDQMLQNLDVTITEDTRCCCKPKR